MNIEVLTYWKTWLVDCSIVLDHVQWDVISTCKYRSTHHPEQIMQWLQQWDCTQVQLGYNLAGSFVAMCRQSNLQNQVLIKVCSSRYL